MRGNFIYKRIGEKVYQYRKAIDLSQEDLSMLSNIDRTYVGRVEQGKANPSIKVMLKLSRVLKVKISDLVEGVG
jgi:transcriptional regulator with XRE-family HTH domain